MLIKVPPLRAFNTSRFAFRGAPAKVFLVFTVILAALSISCSKVDAKGKPMLTRPTVTDHFAAEHDYWPREMIIDGDQGRLEVRRKIGNERQEGIYRIQIPYGRLYQNLALGFQGIAFEACSPPGRDLGSANFLNFTCLHADPRKPVVLRTFSIPQLTDQKNVLGEDLIAKSSAFEMHVILQRSDYLGVVQELNLETKKEEQAQATPVGSNLSAQYGAADDSSSFVICVNFPGVILGSDEKSVPIQVTNLKTGEVEPHSSNASLGQKGFAASRACGKNEWTWSETEHNLENQSVGIGMSPQFSNLPADFPIIGPAFPFHPFSLESLYLSTLADKLNPGSSSNTNAAAIQGVEHGACLRGGLEKFSGAHATGELARFFHSGTAGSLVPFRKDDLLRGLKDQCLILKLSQNPLYTNEMEVFCRSGLENVEFASLPMDVDPGMKEKGCYQGFADVLHPTDDKGVTKWWANHCHIGANFYVRLSSDDDSDYNSFQKLLSLQVSDEGIPAEWSGPVQKLKIDPWSLRLLIERWDQLGHTQVTAEEWSNAPAMLETIRLNYLRGRFDEIEWDR